MHRRRFTKLSLLFGIIIDSGAVLYEMPTGRPVANKTDDNLPGATLEEEKAEAKKIDPRSKDDDDDDILSTRCYLLLHHISISCFSPDGQIPRRYKIKRATKTRFRRPSVVPKVPPRPSSISRPLTNLNKPLVDGSSD